MEIQGLGSKSRTDFINRSTQILSAKRQQQVNRSVWRNHIKPLDNLGVIEPNVLIKRYIFIRIPSLRSI